MAYLSRERVEVFREGGPTKRAGAGRRCDGILVVEEGCRVGELMSVWYLPVLSSTKKRAW